MISFHLSFGIILFSVMILFLCIIGGIWFVQFLYRKIEQLNEKNFFLEKHEKDISTELIKKDFENQSLKTQLEKSKTALQQNQWETQQKESEFNKRIESLAYAQKSFEDALLEQKNKELKQQQQTEEDYYKQWKNHESKVITQIQQLCKTPYTSFSCYTNNNLPPAFPSEIKPDIVVKSGDKFIVFDAKKSKNIKNYIKDQIQSTVEKYKPFACLSRNIFFIIPHEEYSLLEETVYQKSGFSFSILSPLVLPFALFFLKKLEKSEQLSPLCPEEKDKIASLLLEYKHYITTHNAVNLSLTEHSFRLFEEHEAILPLLQTPEESKASKPSISFSLSQIKSKAEQPMAVFKKIQAMKNPLLPPLKL